MSFFVTASPSMCMSTCVATDHPPLSTAKRRAVDALDVRHNNNNVVTTARCNIVYRALTLCPPPLTSPITLSTTTSNTNAKNMKYTYQPNLINYNNTTIKSLHRYAIKGLAGDVVSSMKLYDGDGTFEDDRRFALLYVNDYNNDTIKFDEFNPKWLHKVGILANDVYEIICYIHFSTQIPELSHVHSPSFVFTIQQQL